MDIINRSDNIDEKTTYLCIACKHNKLELVEKLIQEGANLEVEYGKLPIVYSFEIKIWILSNCYILMVQKYLKYYY